MPRKKHDVGLTPEEETRRHADRETARRRVDDFIRIRLRGAKLWDLRDFVREKEKEQGSAWFLEQGQAALSDAQISGYQKKPDEAILESAERDREKVFRRSLARRDELYACALAQGEIRTALSVEQDLA